MKNRKIFLFQIIWILTVIISFPVFMEAQDTNAAYCRSEFDGNAGYELFDLETVINEYNRTAPEQMPGWPINAGFGSGLCLADIYGDGLLAVIVGCTNGEFHVCDNFGNDLPGWPKTGLGAFQSKPAVADMDPDYPGLEIISITRSGTLYIWHNDGTIVSGWPQNISLSANYRAPVISDIDNDGDLEIIVGKSEVNVFNHDGTMYPGWPQSLDSVCSGTVSAADVDNDGVVEICAVSYRSVYLWDKDGNLEQGWPLLNVAGDMCYAQPILADLDDDGDLEILHSYVGAGSSNYVGIYHHDGTNFENWPQTFPGVQTFLTPVVGDIDNDGDLEIFSGGHSFEIMARHHTGEIVDGWPSNIGQILECSPVIFDLDDDGNREIIVGDNSTFPAPRLNAFHGDGSMVDDWPISMTGATMVNSAAVGDVDGDGDLEIALLTSDGSLNLWTLEDIPYRSYLTEWGTWFHDNWNTGWYHPLAPQELTYESSGSSVSLDWNTNTEPDIAGYNIYRSDTEGGPYTKLNNTLITDTSYNYISDSEDNYYCVTTEIKAGTESRLSAEVFGQTGINDEPLEPIISLSNYPNPFNPLTTISFSITENTENTELIIFNLKGQKVKTLVDEELEVGNHQVVWNGKDENGKMVSSGMYFYKLKSGNFTATKKMILMK